MDYNKRFFFCIDREIREWLYIHQHDVAAANKELKYKLHMILGIVDYKRWKSPPTLADVEELRHLLFKNERFISEAAPELWVMLNAYMTVRNIAFLRNEVGSEEMQKKTKQDDAVEVCLDSKDKNSAKEEEQCDTIIADKDEDEDEGETFTITKTVKQTIHQLTEEQEECDDDESDVEIVKRKSYKPIVIEEEELDDEDEDDGEADDEATDSNKCTSEAATPQAPRVIRKKTIIWFIPKKRPHY